MFQQVVELHAQVKLRLAVTQVVSCARVERHFQASSVDLVSFGQPDGVGSGEHSRTLCRLEKHCCRGWYHGRLEPHPPASPVEAAMLAARDGVDQLAIRVEDFDLEIAEDV